MNTQNLIDPFGFSNLTKNYIGSDSVLRKMQELSTDAIAQSKILYPPYNIRKVDDTKYVVEIALAGFAKQNIEIELQYNKLVVKGNINTTEDEKSYIFRGIANRAFTRQFTLADSVVVRDAEWLNGMLKIWLEHIIPEENKPRKIDINEKQ
jgi:molecular chaperone IbpA